MKFLNERFNLSFKWLLFIGVGIIVISSLAVSRQLVSDLEKEEHADMELWADAMKTLVEADASTDLNLVLKVIGGNQSIPVVVVDSAGGVVDWRNINVPSNVDTLKYVARRGAEMLEAGHTMRIPLASGVDVAVHTKEDYILVCYDESLILKRLAYFPYVQLTVIILFLLIMTYAFLSSKRAEQQRIWVGLSRETAHQLGTPTSSLMAWCEVLKECYPNDEMIPELESDVRRLQLIAERFSKIGSVPEIKEENLNFLLHKAATYISRRASDKVHFECSVPSENIHLPLSAPLFEWVIENLCKNAIDAMSGEGSIRIYVYRSEERMIIEVSDSGKGIPKKDWKKVFQPGYTTKKRGWGLGLSLAKRIIEDYHRGKIKVKRSKIGDGTTFLIELPLK